MTSKLFKAKIPKIENFYESLNFFRVGPIENFYESLNFFRAGPIENFDLKTFNFDLNRS